MSGKDLTSSLLISRQSFNNSIYNRQSSQKTGDKSVHYSEFWAESTNWDRRKSLAIFNLYDPKNPENQEIHRLAYEGKVSELESQLRDSLLKPNSFDLTPVIFAIWGEESRGTGEIATSYFILNTFEDKAKEDLKQKFNISDVSLFRKDLPFQTKEKLKESLESLKNEFGHIIQTRPFCFTSHEIAAWNCYNSLAYLIESDYFYFSKASLAGLSMDLEEYSQVFLAVMFKSSNCIELLFNYLVEAVKNPETSKQVLQIIESEIEYYVVATSRSLRNLLDSLMQETTKQIIEDPDDLPKCAMIEDNSIAFYFFLNNPAQDEYISANIWSSAIRLPHVAGSERSLEFIKNLEEAQNLQLFKSPLVKYYVEYKWNQLWSVVFCQDSLLLSNLPLLVVLMFIHLDKQNSSAFWSFIGINALLALLEVVQIIALGPFEYFGGLDKRHTMVILRIGFSVFLAVAKGLGFLEMVPLLNYKLIDLIFYTYLNTLYIVFEKKTAENVNVNKTKIPDMITTVVSTFFVSLITSAVFLIGWDDSLIASIVTGLFAYIFGFVSTLVSNNSISIGLIWNCEISLIVLCQQKYAFSYSLVFELYTLGILTVYLLSYIQEFIFIFVFSLRTSSNNAINEELVKSLKGALLRMILIEISILATFSLNFFLDAYIIIASLTFALSFLALILYYLFFRHQLKESSYFNFYTAGFFLLVINPNDSKIQLIIFAILNILIVFFSIFKQEIYLKKLSKTMKTFIFSWNTVDLVRLFLCLFWVLEITSNSESRDLSFALTVVTLARGLTSFRSFSGTRYYVRLIFNSLNDISSFLVIFMYSTLSFGIISGIYKSDFQVQDIWISSYYVNLGDFSSQQSQLNLTYLSFVAATVINVIIMLNLLISILGDSFDKFQLSSQQIDCMEMTAAILEVESMMFFNRRIQDDGMFLIVCDVPPKMKKEWEGKIIVIKNEIEEIQKRIKEGFEMIFNEIQKGSTGSKEILDLIDQKLSQQTQNLLSEIKNAK